MTHATTAIAAIALAAGLSSAGFDAERLVQFASVDLDSSIIELHNYGDFAMPLDGWRICTHNSVMQFRYSAATGLDGVTLDPGESLFVYMNNNAPADPLNFNRSDLGGFFALPLDQNAYALEIFWPNGGFLSFGAADDMVDHMQWSIDGVSDAGADARSLQAVNAGLWSDASAWISTAADSVSIALVPNGGILQGPGDFTVEGPAAGCNAADIAEPLGVLDLADISAFVGAFVSGGADADIAEPFGVLDLADISAFIGAFTGGCP